MKISLQRRWLPPALLAVSLAIALGPLISVHYVEYDEAIFLDVARNLNRSGQLLRSLAPEGLYFLDHTPLYCYFLSWVTAFSGESIVVARLVTTLFALGSIALVYATVYRVNGALGATVSALILSLNPYFLVYAYFVRMEVPMCFFILLSGYLALTGSSTGRLRYLALSGLSAAIAVLLKEIALIFCVSLIGYALIAARRTLPRPRALVPLAAALGLPSAVGLVLWGWAAWTMSPQGVRAMATRWLGAIAGGGTDAGRASIGVVTWVSTVGGTVVGWALVLLVVIAAVIALRRGRAVLQGPFGLYGLYGVLAIAASLVIKLKEPRYVIALVPAASIVVGAAIDWQNLITWVSARRRRMVLLAVPALLLVISLSPLRLIPRSTGGLSRWVDAVYANRVLENDRYYGAVAEAGLYLKAHAPAEATVAVIHEATVVGYYADRPYWMLYTLTLDQALDVLSKADYLVYDHVVFTRMAQPDVDRVLATIDREYVVEHEIQDRYRRVVVLRRRDAVVRTGPRPLLFTGAGPA